MRDGKGSNRSRARWPYLQGFAPCTFRRFPDRRKSPRSLHPPGVPNPEGSCLVRRPPSDRMGGREREPVLNCCQRPQSYPFDATRQHRYGNPLPTLPPASVRIGAAVSISSPLRCLPRWVYTVSASLRCHGIIAKGLIVLQPNRHSRFGSPRSPHRGTYGRALEPYMHDKRKIAFIPGSTLPNRIFQRSTTPRESCHGNVKQL